jgi:succinoglycan biosynthesis transport protein ExoP
VRPLLTSDEILPVKNPEAPTALTDVVTAFFRNDYKIAVAVLIFLVLLTSFFTFRPKSYESRMVFLVRDEAAALPITSFEEHSQPTMPISDVQIGTEIELLSGTELHRQLISALHPGLSSADLDRRLLTLNKNLVVLPVPKTTLISVTYTAPSKEEANRTLATLSQLYLAYRAGIRGTDGTYAFFDQQANRYYKKLQEDQLALAAFNQEYRVTSIPSEKDEIVRKMADARASVYETEASVREADKQIQAMVAMRSKLPARITTQRRDLPDQATAERLNSSLVELQNKRVELITKYYPTDRHVQELDEQISNTRLALERAQKSKSTEEQTDLNPIRQDVEADLEKAEFRSAGLQARQRSLVTQSNEYQAKLQELNQLTGQYDNLTRQVKEDETSYDLYFKRREEARINRNLDTDKLANVRQIDGPGVVPQSRAQLALSVGSIYLIGILLITGIGILLGLWSPRFHSPWELETASGAPVLATIPVFPKKADGGAPIRRSELPEASGLLARDGFEESERLKPTRLQVLSPASLAAGAANAEHAQTVGVYLPLIQRLRKVDSDTGKGAIFAFTACTRGEGVSHFVRGLGAELTNYTGKQVAIVNAPDIFETVAEAGNETDALIWGRSATSGEKFIQQWFNGLREKHDYVLIDCPALNTSRAATILGPQSDGLMLVVGTGKATRSQVRGSLAMLTLGSVKVVGLALNKRTYPIPDAVYNLL